ncbi:hypothetical protein U9M48_041626 [Paspalum notatum var. saurae]|uniref:Uncharacterized protein n=1 Tax=Paspalum notatum var. saurae TaxID=547442 RepID=A0AAQ3XED0_PASNO
MSSLSSARLICHGSASPGPGRSAPRFISFLSSRSERLAGTPALAPHGCTDGGAQRTRLLICHAPPAVSSPSPAPPLRSPLPERPGRSWICSRPPPPPPSLRQDVPDEIRPTTVYGFV